MAVNDRERDGAHADERRIAALYREAAIEEPPSRLDALVVTAARAAISPDASRHRVPWWQMWRLPLALTCVTLLSVSVVTLVQREGGAPLVLELPLTPHSAPEAAAPAAVGSVETPVSTPASRADAQSGPPAANLGEPVDIKPARAAPAPARSTPRFVNENPDAGAARGVAPERNAAERAERPLAVGSQMARDRVSGVRAREADAEEALREPAMAAAPAAKAIEPSRAAVPAVPQSRAFSRQAPAESALADEAKRLDQPAVRSAQPPVIAAVLAELEGLPPARWIERVLELRREKRADDADAVLAEFKRRHPSEPLPPSLRP